MDSTVIILVDTQEIVLFNIISNIIQSIDIQYYILGDINDF